MKKKIKLPQEPTDITEKPKGCSAFQLLTPSKAVLCNRVTACCRFFTGNLELYKKKYPEHFNSQGDFIG